MPPPPKYGQEATIRKWWLQITTSTSAMHVTLAIRLLLQAKKEEFVYKETVKFEQLV